MQLLFAFLLFLLLPVSLLAQPHQTHHADEAAIKEVLVAAYVEGVFIHRDAEAVREGFHPDFLMHVYHEGQLIQGSLDMWLERLDLDGTANPKKIDYTIETIDVTGSTAFVKMKLYEDTQQIYTDYFGLYRFEDGWKIVNKVFFSHDE